MKNQSFSTVFFLMGLITITSFSQSTYAQESKEDKKMAYYEQRAKQDAAFERSYEAESETEEEAFWKAQQEYESNLKKEDKAAYKAYMKGKRDAYAEHKKHCDHHCHHSSQYHSHASFYYYSGRSYNERPRYRSTINTGVRVRTQGIGIKF